MECCCMHGIHFLLINFLVFNGYNCDICISEKYSQCGQGPFKKFNDSQKRKSCQRLGGQSPISYFPFSVECTCSIGCSYTADTLQTAVYTAWSLMAAFLYTASKWQCTCSVRAAYTAATLKLYLYTPLRSGRGGGLKKIITTFFF